MEKKITVREAFNRLADLLEEGKGFWELEIEKRDGEKLKDVQVVAIKPEGEVLTCLFG
jgi:hypothetical protein